MVADVFVRVTLLAWLADPDHCWNSAETALVDADPASARVLSRWVSPLAGAAVMLPVAFADCTPPTPETTIRPVEPAPTVTVAVCADVPDPLLVVSPSQLFLPAPVKLTAFQAWRVLPANVTVTVSFAAACAHQVHISAVMFVDWLTLLHCVALFPVPTVILVGLVVPMYVTLISTITPAA